MAQLFFEENNQAFRAIEVHPTYRQEDISSEQVQTANQQPGSKFRTLYFHSRVCDL
jgi:hypothetical protein